MTQMAVPADEIETRAIAVHDGGAALGVVTNRMTSENMLAQLQEYERFKALAVRDKAWKTIPGIPGKYLPADEVYRLAPAFGVRWEVISFDEHGQPGVRCDMVDYLTYEKRVIRKSGKGGQSYEAEVDDLTKPIISKTTRYTVTVRATDGSGRYVDTVGAFDRAENPKSDYMCRQQALTRARRRALLILIGGVDVDVLEEEKAQIRLAQAHLAATKVPGTKALIERAVRLGAVSNSQDTTADFLAWAKVAADVNRAKGDTLTAADKRAIVSALDKFEGLEAPAAEGEYEEPAR